MILSCSILLYLHQVQFDFSFLLKNRFRRFAAARFSCKRIVLSAPLPTAPSGGFLDYRYYRRSSFLTLPALSSGTVAGIWVLLLLLSRRWLICRVFPRWLTGNRLTRAGGASAIPTVLLPPRSSNKKSTFSLFLFEPEPPADSAS